MTLQQVAVESAVVDTVAEVVGRRAWAWAGAGSRFMGREEVWRARARWRKQMQLPEMVNLDAQGWT